MKPVQFFSDDYLQQCKTFSTEAILDYLDNFRLMQQPTDKTRLISIKIPESLLASFRAKSELHQTKYQTQIKKLMTDWVNNQNENT
jgi:predicted DNA binding CopG/RHH family protein